MTVVFVS